MIEVNNRSKGGDIYTHTAYDVEMKDLHMRTKVDRSVDK